MNTNAQDTPQAGEPQELATDELERAQGGAATSTVTIIAGDGTSAAVATRKPHVGGVNFTMSDGSVR